MNKFILYIGITILFIGCSKENDLKQFGLKGKVKSLTESYYTPINKGGNWVAGEKINSLKMTFNKNGQLITHEDFDKENRFIGTLTHIYENQKLKEKIYTNSKGNIFSKIVIIDKNKDSEIAETFDDKGYKINQVITYFEEGLISKQIYTLFRKNGDLGSQTVKFGYDQNDNLLSFERKDDFADEILLHIKSKYIHVVSNGNWTQRLDYLGDYEKQPINIVYREYEFF